MTTINGKACVANGRNLIHDTSFRLGLWKTAFGNPSFEITNEGNLKFSIGNTSQNGVGAPLEPVEMLKQYTLTAKVRGHGKFQPYIMYDRNYNLNLYDELGATNPMIDSATEFVEIKYTFTPVNHDTTKQGVFAVLTADAVGNWLEIKKDSLKLEQGSVATPLTPEPVDKVFSNGKQVYGRNMLTGTSNVQDYTISGKGWALGTKSTNGSNLSIPGTPGAMYTYSAIVKSTTYDCFPEIQFFDSGKNWISDSNTIMGTDIGLRKATAVAPANAAFMQVHMALYNPPDSQTVVFNSEKLALGTIVTPWTPAPEDVM